MTPLVPEHDRRFGPDDQRARTCFDAPTSSGVQNRRPELGPILGRARRTRDGPRGCEVCGPTAQGVPSREAKGGASAARSLPTTRRPGEVSGAGGFPRQLAGAAGDSSAIDTGGIPTGRSRTRALPSTPSSAPGDRDHDQGPQRSLSAVLCRRTPSAQGGRRISGNLQPRGHHCAVRSVRPSRCHHLPGTAKDPRHPGHASRLRWRRSVKLTTPTESSTRTRLALTARQRF